MTAKKERSQIGCQNSVSCVVYWEKAGLDSCGADPSLSEKKMRGKYRED